jgi:hypothetical protein
MRFRIELLIGKGDCQGIEPELGSAVNQFMRRVGNAIRGVVRTVGMKVDFQHSSAPFHTILQVLPVRSGHPQRY